VLEGTFEDDEFFAYIAAIDEDDDPYDPANWGKANPNLGVSVYESFMVGQAKKAERDPLFYNEFLQLHLNRWTQQITRCHRSGEVEGVRSDRRGGCGRRARSTREEALAGRECSAGIDLSERHDLTAAVLAFRGPDDVVEYVCRFWLPEATIEEHAKKGRKFYAQWVREGWITATPGEVIDYAFVRQEINELGKKYRIQQIAIDPHSATQITTELGEQDGFDILSFRQGMLSMSEPTKDFEARVTSRKILHGGNPVLAWQVGNLAVVRDSAGNIKPDKDKAKDKIDGVVAAIMATARAVLQEGSVYTPERGFLSL
jgi:phage terminase large subunit-like protein